MTWHEWQIHLKPMQPDLCQESMMGAVGMGMRRRSGTFQFRVLVGVVNCSPTNEEVSGCDLIKIPIGAAVSVHLANVAPAWTLDVGALHGVPV